MTETPLGESSKVINIFTKELGLIGVVAKNSKSIKNPLRVKSNKFTYGTFHIHYNENKLSKLIDVDIINHLENIKKDIILISYMSYITELTKLLLKTTEAYKIYNQFIDSIIKINELYNPLVITNILELNYLKHLGSFPTLDNCSICNNNPNIITLSKEGLICNKCYNNEPIIDSKTIKTIRLYSHIDIKKITKLEIEEETSLLINSFLNEYYEENIGVKLNSKKFLQSLL